ncbi:MAG TPA: ABC transporter permease subunit [Bacillota bacterium]|nr:ABC transporter permease subunit [Bacillota bacterium]
MRDYFIRRLILVIPTLLGITLACFILMHFVPGGPVEQALMKLKNFQSQGAGVSRGNLQDNLTQDEIKNIRHYYGFDQPVLVRYFRWLGKVVRLDLGNSYTYQRPVLEVISTRFPVSLTFGLFGLFASYLVCIPLGVKKALTHQETFDHVTSILVFIAYAIPPFALGILLIVLFGGGTFLNIFPIAGTVSDNFEKLSWLGKIWDYAYHMFLPLICYTIGGFATLTLLMKNSLMEELSQDYIRTALAKGLSYRQAVFRHALRNALIPLATNIGMILTVIFSGSLLIEKVFTIDGMGLLAYDSTVNRDYPVALGIILLTSLLILVGRIISDICLVLVDPRIRFNGSK